MKSISLKHTIIYITVVLNREGAPPQGGVKKFSGGREPLHALQSTTWKVFERECVPSKGHASAHLTSLHVIWFSSGRDGSRG